MATRNGKRKQKQLPTSGVLVALIGLAVVMLYLLFFYRGLGLITAAAMIVFEEQRKAGLDPDDVREVPFP